MKNNLIYRHLKPNGEVFYIGIGTTKKRAYSKQSRNPLWHNIVDKYGYEVQILKKDLSWEEACELETLLINYYGRRDLGTGSLVNMTDGGEGKTNVVVSDETREKLSVSHKGLKYTPWTEERKKASSLRYKGKLTFPNRTKTSRGYKVLDTITNETYPSISRAAKAINMNGETLRNQLLGKYKNKTNLIIVYITDNQDKKEDDENR